MTAKVDPRTAAESVTYANGGALGTEQTRRAMCLSLAVYLFSGRGVAWSNLMGIAEWLYSGTEAKP